MDTEKLTSLATDGVTTAVRLALSAGNPQAEPVHLLRALLLTPNSSCEKLLNAAGIDAKVISQEAESAIKQLPSTSGSSVAQPQLSGSLARVLADAETRAQAMGDQYVATSTLR